MLHWICIYLVETAMVAGEGEVGVGAGIDDIKALAKEEGVDTGGKPKNENGLRKESSFVQMHEILLHQSDVGVIESLRGSLPKGNENAKKELFSWMLGNEGLIKPGSFSHMLSEDHSMNLDVEGGTIDPQWDLDNADDLSSDQVDLLLKYLVRKEKAFLHAGDVVTLEYEEGELVREKEFVKEMYVANAVGGSLPDLDGAESDEKLFENRMDDFKARLEHKGYKTNGKGEILWEEYGSAEGGVSHDTESDGDGSGPEEIETTYEDLSQMEVKMAKAMGVHPGEDGVVTREMYKNATKGHFGDRDRSEEKPKSEEESDVVDEVQEPSEKSETADGEVESISGVSEEEIKRLQSTKNKDGTLKGRNQMMRDQKRLRKILLESDGESVDVAQEVDGKTAKEKDEPEDVSSNPMLAAFQKAQGGDQTKKKIPPLHEVQVEPVTAANFEETARAMRSGGKIVPEKSENDSGDTSPELELTSDVDVNKERVKEAWKLISKGGGGVRIGKDGILQFTHKGGRGGDVKVLLTISTKDLGAVFGQDFGDQARLISRMNQDGVEGYHLLQNELKNFFSKVHVSVEEGRSVSAKNIFIDKDPSRVADFVDNRSEVEVEALQKGGSKKKEELVNLNETGEVREDFEDLWKRLGMETLRGGEKTVEGRMGAKLIIPEDADYGDMQIVLQAEGKTIKLKIEDFFNNLSGLLNDDGKKAISNLMIDDDGVIKPTENVLEWSKALIELKAYGESPSRVSVELLREEGGASVAEHFRDYRANVIEGVYGDEDRSDDDFSMEIHLWRRPATVNVLYKDDEGKKGKVYMPVADFFKQIGADVKGLSAKEASDWKKLLKKTFGKDRSGMKIDIQNEDPNRKKK